MKPSQPATRKRFYKSADAAEREGGAFAVLLDGRQVKTPAGKPLAVPARGLAEAIAAEWNAQGETIVPASLPLTKLANTAIDAVAERKGEVVEDIINMPRPTLCAIAPNILPNWLRFRRRHGTRFWAGRRPSMARRS